MKICQLHGNWRPRKSNKRLTVWTSSAANTSSCDKEIRIRIGIANSAVKRLDCIWRQKSLGLPVKMWLYESTVLAILLHILLSKPKMPGSLPSQMLEKTIECYLEEQRDSTRQDKLKNTIRKRYTCPQCWFCQVQRMEDSRRALHWTAENKMKRGWPRITWRDRC